MSSENILILIYILVYIISVYFSRRLAIKTYPEELGFIDVLVCILPFFNTLVIFMLYKCNNNFTNWFFGIKEKD